MGQQYIIMVFTENKVGLLGQVTTVFTYRCVNIESITASSSEIDGVHKYTIVVNADKEIVEKVVKQIEKKVDVLRALYYKSDEVVQQEIALYKIVRSTNVEKLVREHNIRILEICDDYLIIEKTGHKEETQHLYEVLKPYGVEQFVRSGKVAIVKAEHELLKDYITINKKRI